MIAYIKRFFAGLVRTADQPKPWDAGMTPADHKWLDACKEQDRRIAEARRKR